MAGGRIAYEHLTARPPLHGVERGSWIGRWLLILAAGLALVGVGVAGYLAWTHYANEQIACSGVGDCNYVNSTDYAKLAGVPVSVLGALAYASMFVLVAASWIRRAPMLAVAAWGIAFASFAFSAWLTYVELFVIDAICVYCVASASVATGLFVLLSAWVWVMREELLGEV